MTAAPIAGLGSLDDVVCAGLRAHFAAAGFSADLVSEAERFAPGVLSAPRLPLLHWWLSRRGGAGAALARLFVYHDRLTESEARAALGADLLAALMGAGILGAGVGVGAGAAAGDVNARFIITPADDGLWVLSDALTAGPQAVMGPGGGTQHLARLIPRRFDGAALDLGCGAGSLALVAARRGARRAVGIDLNPRAIEIADFNARLNGLRVDFRTGDVTEPVAGQLFDLVLSQPPFVVHPPGQPDVTFLDGGPTGDELPQRFVAAMARALGPGGRGLALLQSGDRDKRPLAARLRAALGGAPCDLVVLATKAPPPAVQASVFASYADPTLGQRYAEVARSYLDAFESLGVHDFTGGLVALGRPREDGPRGAQPDGTATDAPGATHRATVDRYTLGLRLSHQDYDAASLEQFLRGLDLIGTPPEAFARTRLRLAPSAHLMTETAEADGDDSSSFSILRIEPPGIGTDWKVSTEDLKTLDAIIEADSLLGATEILARARRASPADLRDGILAFARDALVRGALIRADK